MGVSQVESRQLVRAGQPAEVRGQVEKLLQFDIGELTIIPFAPSKQSVLEMFAKGVMDKRKYYETEELLAVTKMKRAPPFPSQ